MKESEMYDLQKQNKKYMKLEVSILIYHVMYDIFPLMDNAKYVYNYLDDLAQLQFVYNQWTKV
jgi:hypothetical protein